MRAYWTQKAKEEELQHKEKYPNYHFAANKTKKAPLKRKSPTSQSPGCSPPRRVAKHDMADD
ncbi:hypothetical protein IMZ48_08650 [Candidatus Bathyarchaeota archaeon]|nr:hypothetical protein [Candidatus Bathyarchaeota archaeon]